VCALSRAPDEGSVGRPPAEFARRGARGLILVDLPGDELEAATAGLGEQALAIGADVTDADAMRGAVAAARNRDGALDVVVANAGIERIGSVRGQPPEDFGRDRGQSARCLRDPAAGDRSRGRTARPPHRRVLRGRDVGVSADHGVRREKAAVASLMRGLRAELTGTGATAGAAFFGFIDTSMIERARAHPAFRHGMGRDAELDVAPDSSGGRRASDRGRYRASQGARPASAPRRRILAARRLHAGARPITWPRRLDVPTTVRIAEIEERDRNTVVR
jgi:NAD(P)-dependent dehydrogenase (short-subunit alcohol dehydrogenase family)